MTNILTSVESTYTTQTVYILRVAKNTVLTTFENGIAVTVSVVTGLPIYTIAVPSTYNITGMLGNYNGNPDDDFIYPNGTILPSNFSDRQLYSFGQSCKHNEKWV